jgi:hypothetical protein
MGSSTREEIVEVFDALKTDLDRLCELSFDVFTTPERLWALERLECAARRLRAPQQALRGTVAVRQGEQPHERHRVDPRGRRRHRQKAVPDCPVLFVAGSGREGS